MSCGRNYYKCGHLGADLQYDKRIFFAIKVVYVLIWTYLIDYYVKQPHKFVIVCTTVF